MSDRATASRGAIEAALKAAEMLRDYRLVLEQKPLPDFPAPPVSEPQSALPQDDLPVSPNPRRVPAPASARRFIECADAVAPVDVLALGQPDWLYHELTVSGAEADVSEFQRRARGSGVIPWQRDYTGLEEDLFLLLMRDRQDSWGLGSTSAHALAGRVREFAEQQEMRAQAGDRTPLDLHALVPVPAALLPLGPQDPGARAWLWQNWGTTKPLRCVTAFERLRTVPGDEASTPRWRVAFWSADWSPWSALRHLAKAWPGLNFRLRPVYERD